MVREKWKELFDKTWPYYKRWFLSEGYKARPGYLSSVGELSKHMPEIMPIYTNLVELVGGDELKARFLSMYCPPAYMSACSQLAYTKGSNTLIRNYDYSLKLFEGTMLCTNWLQPVMGVSDSNWGLLDGMNSSGLSASLTFGGRKISGRGFGIPLVIRYILETSSTTKEAVELLINDPETEAVVMIGEIGGQLEADAANWYKASGSKKPVVGFIAGETAPAGRTMGHAGAIVGGSDDTAQAKKKIMRACGIHVVDSPAEIGKKIAEVLG